MWYDAMAFIVQVNNSGLLFQHRTRTGQTEFGKKIYLNSKCFTCLHLPQKTQVQYILVLSKLALF